MRDDDRARVPFALVGVVLLATSVSLVATVGTDDADAPAIDRAMDGATAEVMTALRGAADDAATVSAAEPVTRPANTTVGQALDDDRPFEDALRLRVYLLAEARLGGVEVRRGDVTVTASIPSVEPTTEGYREAIDRVEVEPTGDDDTAMRVTVQNVTVTATADGRGVVVEERAPSFVVANPALSMHRRAERFERRANAPVTEAGLAQRLTTRLYPIAWARGYAQYGGAPVTTVVGTRHVELATNDALLAEQQAVFGSVDPDGDRGVARAGRRVVTADLLEAAEAVDWTDVVLDGDNSGGDDGDDDGGDDDADDETSDWEDDRGGERSSKGPVGSWDDAAPDPEVRVRIGDDATADRAFVDLVGEPGEDPVSKVIEQVHTVEARVTADVDRQRASRSGDRRPDGGGWSLVDETVDRTADVGRSGDVDRLAVFAQPGDVERPASDGGGSMGGATGGWSTRERVDFEATVNERRTRTWERDDETRVTESTVVSHYLVAVAVEARTHPVAGAPPGALDAALADATGRATARAVRRAGGLDGAARAAVSNGDDGTPTASATADPVVDRDDVVADLRSVRDETADLDVSVPATELGAGRVNPAARLVETLADRRQALRGPRGTSAETRTFLAVRTAYLDAVEQELHRGAAAHHETSQRIDAGLGRHLPAERVDGAIAAHRAANRPEPASYADPVGNVTFAVETGPSYLPTTQVSQARIDARGEGTVRPLATRNVNVFASPHEQVARSILERLPFLRRGGVSLETAAATLSAMESVPDDLQGPLAAERESLEREVEVADAYVRETIVDALVDEEIDQRAARAAVEADPDRSTASAAQALANGSATDEIVDELTADAVGSDHDQADRLASRVDVAREDALRDGRGRPSRTTTTEAADVAREVAHDELQRVIADGVESAAEEARVRALGELAAEVPAGMPVAPVPGYWYATTNLWYVETAGTYERFVVRADRGGPTGAVTYLREGQVATVTHDGRERRLGSAERVSFRTETVVVVVVPPGGRGVGDTDGELDERSPGWPP